MRPINLVSLLLPSTLTQAASTADPLTVKTTTGIYTGLIDEQFPHVRQFRSIPFALPPIGARRWLPPVAVSPSLRRSFAYRFPPSCPQYQSKNPTAWSTNITDFAIRLYGQSYTAGAMAQASSEDCLYLAIWTPLNATTSTNSILLPVALFIPGGDFVGGGVDVPYQKPAGWVERTQNHIVVTTNYRVNIAGFPWAAGLDTQNVGLLDQRMALEWVYANIAAFGGDASRITLWGQSAGGVAVDMLAHAWPDNPLISGLFMQSGTAMVAIAPPDPTHSNFTFVAKNLGCDFPDDPRSELECMRLVPMSLIQNFMGGYKDNATKPTLGFRPSPDEQIVFRNYSQRAEMGLVAKVPAVVSITANEHATLYKYPATNVTEGPYQPAVDAGTVSVFVCLASNTTQARKRLNLTTYRYEYAGNFSSVTPLWWMGAYHASDIPMVFGTYEGRFGALDSSSGTASEGEDGPGWASKVGSFQRQVADRMQDYLLAFMRDPENGPRKVGWLAYGDVGEGAVDGGKNMIRFAAGGRVERTVSADEVDDACVLGTKFDSSPEQR
ncbi:Alpha/Beta hydrolase protein [Apodospora peruviana]|uniref:Carboxylic ester hydrolase n=1 Tax=Apodospora peruviana TaxID=516989 RepID=A0AAE0M2L4_9PEZI|nr:Alpha/Beta hydrolase protein [Apodospora peruviana]